MEDHEITPVVAVKTVKIVQAKEDTKEGREREKEERTRRRRDQILILMTLWDHPCL